MVSNGPGSLNTESMKIINSRLHGIFDYLTGIVLLLPFITDYNADSTDSSVLAVIGALTIMLALFTDYEWGVIKVIPMKAHLGLDVLIALFTIAVPWLFPLHNYLFYWPVMLGVAELIIIVLSSPQAYTLKPRDHDISRP